MIYSIYQYVSLLELNMWNNWMTNKFSDLWAQYAWFCNSILFVVNNVEVNLSGMYWEFSQLYGDFLSWVDAMRRCGDHGTRNILINATITTTPLQKLENAQFLSELQGLGLGDLNMWMPDQREELIWKQMAQSVDAHPAASSGHPASHVFLPSLENQDYCLHHSFQHESESIFLAQVLNYWQC